MKGKLEVTTVIRRLHSNFDFFRFGSHRSVRLEFDDEAILQQLSSRVRYERLAFLVLGCSVQTWLANSLSRCVSKFRINSSKDLPVSASEEVNTQPHSVQPQP